MSNAKPLLDFLKLILAFAPWIAPARTKVVAVDVARRLPFPLATAVAPGLVPVEAPENMLIGFSTSPGLVVTDAVQSHGPWRPLLPKWCVLPDSTLQARSRGFERARLS